MKAVEMDLEKSPERIKGVREWTEVLRRGSGEEGKVCGEERIVPVNEDLGHCVPANL